MKIKIKSGVNLRLPADETPIDQAFLLQNFDMTHKEYLEQIKGSAKYHGNTIGTNDPSAIIINYNEADKKQDVLVCVDDKILKKNFGANEFEELIAGLTPNKINFGVCLEDKTYIASPVDGLFEYDGISKITKLITNPTLGTSIKLRDIIYSKETNRCFGITVDDELVWTDDLVDLGGVPIQWNALNISGFPRTDGDIVEKIFIRNGRLVILKTNSIFVYYILGAPSQWRPQKISFSGGCIAPKTVKEVGQELWFLGFSPATGRGVYAMDDSGSVRLLSYDVEPMLDRINYHRIKESCAEYVNNIYKLSFSVDSANVNNYTFHFDTINISKETGSPNIYGPHTYGFNCSAVLNTTKFQGEHLFGRTHTDGARIFRVADYRTQYSDELTDNGDLIMPIMVSGIRSVEGDYDEMWLKRYSNLYIEYPSQGTWAGTIKVLKGASNEVFKSFEQFLEGGNYSLESLNLNTDPVDLESISSSMLDMNFVSDAIQIIVTNSNVNTKLAFKSVHYMAKPDRRKKNVEIVQF